MATTPSLTGSVRGDLSARECAEVLGRAIEGMLIVFGDAPVHAVFKFWATTDSVWALRQRVDALTWGAPCDDMETPMNELVARVVQDRRDVGERRAVGMRAFGQCDCILGGIIGSLTRLAGAAAAREAVAWWHEHPILLGEVARAVGAALKVREVDARDPAGFLIDRSEIEKVYDELERERSTD